jgi:hypothetical protein
MFDPQANLEDWLQGGGVMASGPTPNYTFDFHGLPTNYGL